MFLSFFYLLRARGIDVSLNEWVTLMEAMSKGLHSSNLMGFYHLCRAVLLKSEVDFDRFDQVFMEFFKDVQFPIEIPDHVMDKLINPSWKVGKTAEELRMEGFQDEEMKAMLEDLQYRLSIQKSEHQGGNYYVATQGNSPFGNSGWHTNGIRIAGEGRNRSAMMVAGERKFRDFRKDNKLDNRQFQMAFRLLRQMAADSSEQELDIDTTIHDTCDEGGILQVRYKNARKNRVKVLLLMDSGGSMEYYSKLCSMLFQSATKANQFKELKIYYFHNCILSNMYTHPSIRVEDEIATEWILKNYDGSYRVIIVGDASMNPHELHDKQYHWGTGIYRPSGLDWLNAFKKQYSHLVWLNPSPMPDTEYPGFWFQTHKEIADIIPMYPLSVDGMEKGMKRLMVNR